MAVTLVNSTSQVWTSAPITGPLTLTIPKPADGNALMLTWLVGDATGTGGPYATIASVVGGTTVGTWHKGPQATLTDASGFPLNVEIWGLLAVSGGTTSVVIALTHNPVNGSAILDVAEFSPGPGKSFVGTDGSHAATGLVGPIDPGAITTTVADDAIVASYQQMSGYTTSVPSPWTTLVPSYRTPVYYLPGATGTYHPVWTMGQDANWVAVILALKTSAGGLVRNASGSPAEARTRQSVAKATINEARLALAHQAVAIQESHRHAIQTKPAVMEARGKTSTAAARQVPMEARGVLRVGRTVFEETAGSPIKSLLRTVAYESLYRWRPFRLLFHEAKGKVLVPRGTPVEARPPMSAWQIVSDPAHAHGGSWVLKKTIV